MNPAFIATAMPLQAGATVARLSGRARCWALAVVASGLLGLSSPPAAAQNPVPQHFTVNLRGDYAGAASVGFNLMDVGAAGALDSLPDGVKGVFWLGNGFNSECAWRLDDRAVANAVKQVAGHPKFSGIYYIADEPHPSVCPEAPDRIAERSQLVRSLDPKGKTFIVVQNGSKDPGEFYKLKAAADYIGITLYPCNKNNHAKGCTVSAIQDRVDQAREAGIHTNRLVPVFQSFGQDCTMSDSKYYRLPSVQETQAMLAAWDEKLPRSERPFDMTYTWGPQERSACPTLQMADGKDYPDLRTLYSEYFTQME
jgi:hypothetical protein